MVQGADLDGGRRRTFLDTFDRSSASTRLKCTLRFALASDAWTRGLKPSGIAGGRCSSEQGLALDITNCGERDDEGGWQPVAHDADSEVAQGP